jgi:hypothetical protein
MSSFFYLIIFQIFTKDDDGCFVEKRLVITLNLGRDQGQIYKFLRR